MTPPPSYTSEDPIVTKYRRLLKTVATLSVLEHKRVQLLEELFEKTFARGQRFEKDYNSMRQLYIWLCEFQEPEDRVWWDGACEGSHPGQVDKLLLLPTNVLKPGPGMPGYVSPLTPLAPYREEAWEKIKRIAWEIFESNRRLGNDATEEEGVKNITMKFQDLGSVVDSMLIKYELLLHR